MRKFGKKIPNKAQRDQIMHQRWGLMSIRERYSSFLNKNRALNKEEDGFHR